MYPKPGKHLFVTFDLLPFHWDYLLLTNLLLVCCSYIWNLKWSGCGLSLWTADPAVVFNLLLELKLLWQTGCQHSEHSSVTASTGRLTAPLTPSFPLRSEESALQASGRRAEERQEALWRSEPTANEQRRSGHVRKRRGSAHVIRSEKETEKKCREGETGG